MLALAPPAVEREFELWRSGVPELVPRPSPLQKRSKNNCTRRGWWISKTLHGSKYLALWESLHSFLYGHTAFLVATAGGLVEKLEVGSHHRLPGVAPAILKDHLNNRLLGFLKMEGTKDPRDTCMGLGFRVQGLGFREEAYLGEYPY